MRSAVMVLAVAAFLAGAAFGEIKTYLGAGGPINDLATNRFTIFVPDHGPAAVDSLMIDMFHTWSGDLVIDVRHVIPMDYTVVLMPNKVDVSNPDDYNGQYVFRDGYTPLPIYESGDGLIEPGTYGPYYGQTLSRFVPDKFGEWVLVIRDIAPADVGVVRNWSMTFNNVPAPGASAALGIACIFACRRRREGAGVIEPYVFLARGRCI